jgi:mRNA interferase MazF
MKKPTKTYDAYQVVLVPFPFIDQSNSKKRPALVLSASDHFNLNAGASVLAMITTSFHAPWPLDIPILNLESAGLPVPSVIRMKLFTLDHRLIFKKLGVLHALDHRSVEKSLKRLFNL